MSEPRSDDRSAPAAGTPLFAERPKELMVYDAFTLGALPLGLALLSAILGWGAAAVVFLGLAVFVACFFRNLSQLGFQR